MQPLVREARQWTEGRLGGTPMLSARYWNQEFTRHYHDYFVIAVSEAGADRCWHRGVSTVVPSGVITIVNPGEVHASTRVGDEPWVYRALYPTPAYLSELFGELHERRHVLPRFERLVYSDRRLAARFVTAHRLLEKGTQPLRAETLMLGVLTDLLASHARPGKTRLAAGTSRGVIEAAASFIDSHLDQPVTLDQLARIAGMSRFGFVRRFARELGLPPHAYVVQRRLERAGELLRDGASIADAASAVGFADQSHLTRRFKAAFGVTPGEFARQPPGRSKRPGPGRG